MAGHGAPVGDYDQLHRSHINFVTWHCKYRLSHSQMSINIFVLRILASSASHWPICSSWKRPYGITVSWALDCPKSWIKFKEWIQFLMRNADRINAFAYLNKWTVKISIKPQFCLLPGRMFVSAGSSAWYPHDWDLAPPLGLRDNCHEQIIFHTASAWRGVLLLIVWALTIVKCIISYKLLVIHSS